MDVYTVAHDQVRSLFGTVFRHSVKCAQCSYLLLYPTKKRNAYSRVFFSFLGAGSNFLVIASLQFCSAIIYQFMPESSFDLVQKKSESVISLAIREGSKSNVKNVSV